MTRRGAGRRAGSLLVSACLLVPVSATVTGVSAAAAPLSHCTTTSGVVVAVDFRHFGGAIERGCSPTPTTGYDALHNAGYTTAGDDEDGPAFICRIDGKPTPAQQPCTRTPSDTAAWSYWFADPGHDTWSFHELGAMSTHPKPGSVDAWVFGSTAGGGNAGEPTFSPASVRATTASPTPSHSPSVAPTPATHPAGPPAPRQHRHQAPVAPSTAATPHPSRAAAGRPHHPHRKRSATSTAAPSPSSDPSALTAKESSGPRIVDATGADPATSGTSGSPTGLLVGVALVVVLGGAGVATAWRRRRGSP